MAAIDIADAKVNQLVVEAITKGLETVLHERLGPEHLRSLESEAPRTSKDARFGLMTPTLGKLRRDMAAWTREPDRPLTLEIHRRCDSKGLEPGAGARESLSERWVFAFARSRRESGETPMPSGERLATELRRFHLAASTLLRSIFATVVAVEAPSEGGEGGSITYRLVVSHPSRESPHAAAFPDGARVHTHQLAGPRSTLGAIVVSLDARSPAPGPAGQAGAGPESLPLTSLVQGDWFTEGGGARAEWAERRAPEPIGVPAHARGPEGPSRAAARTSVASAAEMAAMLAGPLRWSPKLGPTPAPTHAPPSLPGPGSDGPAAGAAAGPRPHGRGRAESVAVFGDLPRTPANRPSSASSSPSMGATSQTWLGRRESSGASLAGQPTERAAFSIKADASAGMPSLDLGIAASPAAGPTADRAGAAAWLRPGTPASAASDGRPGHASVAPAGTPWRGPAMGHEAPDGLAALDSGPALLSGDAASSRGAATESRTASIQPRPDAASTRPGRAAADEDDQGWGRRRIAPFAVGSAEGSRPAWLLAALAFPGDL